MELQNWSKELSPTSNTSTESQTAWQSIAIESQARKILLASGKQPEPATSEKSDATREAPNKPLNEIAENN